MKIFPAGIPITDVEMKCLLHIVVDAEVWLERALRTKAHDRREALVHEWRPRLILDPNVSFIPLDPHVRSVLIMARGDYTSRAQQDIVSGDSESFHHRNKFAGRKPGQDRSTTLLRGGLDLPDDDAAVILAYVQNVEEWVIGALAGQINRGRKVLIAEYMPILLADDAVTEIPADEDDLIGIMTARPDYVTKASRG